MVLIYYYNGDEPTKKNCTALQVIKQLFQISSRPNNLLLLGSINVGPQHKLALRFILFHGS
jgi:hypothetical protein